MAVFWVVAPCSLVEVYRPDDGGTSTSETSVDFYHTTRRKNPEDSHLHTRRRENLKSNLYVFISLEFYERSFPFHLDKL
jgi:hypothetical protein